MYVVYKNFDKVAEKKSLRKVAEFIGCFAQSIARARKANGFYEWKDYLIVNTQKQDARASYAFARLSWFFKNPATSYIAGLEIVKTVDNIKSRILDDCNK